MQGTSYKQSVKRIEIIGRLGSSSQLRKAESEEEAQRAERIAARMKPR